MVRAMDTDGAAPEATAENVSAPAERLVEKRDGKGNLEKEIEQASWRIAAAPGTGARQTLGSVEVTGGWSSAYAKVQPRPAATG